MTGRYSISTRPGAVLRRRIATALAGAAVLTALAALLTARFRRHDPPDPRSVRVRARSGPTASTSSVSPPAASARERRAAGAGECGKARRTLRPARATSPDPARPEAADPDLLAPGPGAAAAPAILPASVGPARSEAGDPALVALAEAGVDLEHPDDEMLRLAREYRALLDDLARTGTADRIRMAQLDRAMAALIRVKPETTRTVYHILAAESLPPAARYFGHLLRSGARELLEGALTAMAATDPDSSRRAGALAALGPSPNRLALDAVQRGLEDPSPEVRDSAVMFLLEAARIDPGDPAVRSALRRAVCAERDVARKDRLLQGFLALAEIASKPDGQFLTRLAGEGDEDGFAAAVRRATGRR